MAKGRSDLKNTWPVTGHVYTEYHVYCKTCRKLQRAVDPHDRRIVRDSQRYRVGWEESETAALALARTHEQVAMASDEYYHTIEIVIVSGILRVKQVVPWKTLQAMRALSNEKRLTS